MRSSALCGLLASLLAGTSGWGQSEEAWSQSGPPEEALGGPSTTAIPAPEPEDGLTFRLIMGGEHQLEINVDGGGDMSVNRLYGAIGVTAELSRDLTLSMNFGYEYSEYDFDGTTTIGGEKPWGNIHTYGFSSRLTFTLTNELSFFFGPVFQVSKESGADWDDAWVGGGVVGTVLRIDESLILGLGLGAIDQLQDSVRVFPVVILDWKITNDFRARSRTSGSAAGRQGLELIYDLGEGLEIAAGIGYHYRRFRLSDQGIGEDTSIPIWLRLGIDITPSLKLSVHAGFAANGQLEKEQGNGEQVKEDYDEAGVFGLRVSYRF